MHDSELRCGRGGGLRTPDDGPLQILPEAAVLVDGYGRLVDRNRLAAVMFGPTGPLQASALTEALRQVPGFAGWLAGGGDQVFRGRLHARRANGVPLTVELSARRLDSPAGGAVCLLIEPAAARVAGEAQRYFDIAFDAAPIGMALFNTDGEYVRVNPSLCTMLGRTAEELLGRRDQELTHPDDRRRDVEAAWSILRGERSTWQCEKRFLRPGGAVVWAIANLTFLRDGEGNPLSWVGQFQDITARKALEADLRGRERLTRRLLEAARQAEEEQARARAAAVEASKMKSEFLANMSHEIRTPLNGIIGTTELLLRTELTDAQRELAETARNSGDVLLGLLNDVLDLSKIEAGKLELERRPFAVRRVVGEVARLLAAQAASKDLTLEVAVDADVPVALVGDSGRIRQALTNLVSNAIKFTEVGGVSIGVTVAEPGPCPLMRFAVRDTGVGVSAAHHEHLFEAFTQADASTTRRYGGTGLGLAIAKRLATLMGGTIGLSSVPGEGSVFWFTARLTAPPAVTAPGPLAGGLLPLPPGPHRPAAARVLVAEDNPVNQQVAVAMLAHLGFDADVVGDGAQAVEAVARGGYAAVVMDCQMPVVNGYQAATAIRRAERSGAGGAGPRMPIIALTASALTGDADTCLAAGMDAYLSKPVRLEDLAEALDRLVRSPAGSALGRAEGEPGRLPSRL